MSDTETGLLATELGGGSSKEGDGPVGDCKPMVKARNKRGIAWLLLLAAMSLSALGCWLTFSGYLMQMAPATAADHLFLEHHPRRLQEEHELFVLYEPSYKDGSAEEQFGKFKDKEEVVKFKDGRSMKLHIYEFQSNEELANVLDSIKKPATVRTIAGMMKSITSLMKPRDQHVATDEDNTPKVLVVADKSQFEAELGSHDGFKFRYIEDDIAGWSNEEEQMVDGNNHLVSNQWRQYLEPTTSRCYVFFDPSYGSGSAGEQFGKLKDTERKMELEHGNIVNIKFVEIMEADDKWKNTMAAMLKKESDNSGSLRQKTMVLVAAHLKYSFMVIDAFNAQFGKQTFSINNIPSNKNRLPGESLDFQWPEQMEMVNDQNELLRSQWMRYFNAKVGKVTPWTVSFFSGDSKKKFPLLSEMIIGQESDEQFRESWRLSKKFPFVKHTKKLSNPIGQSINSVIGISGLKKTSPNGQGTNSEEGNKGNQDDEEQSVGQPTKETVMPSSLGTRTGYKLLSEDTMKGYVSLGFHNLAAKERRIVHGPTTGGGSPESYDVELGGMRISGYKSTDLLSQRVGRLLLPNVGQTAISKWFNGSDLQGRIDGIVVACNDNGVKIKVDGTDHTVDPNSELKLARKATVLNLIVDQVTAQDTGANENGSAHPDENALQATPQKSQMDSAGEKEIKNSSGLADHDEHQSHETKNATGGKGNVLKDPVEKDLQATPQTSAFRQSHSEVEADLNKDSERLDQSHKTEKETENGPGGSKSATPPENQTPSEPEYRPEGGDPVTVPGKVAEVDLDKAPTAAFDSEDEDGIDTSDRGEVEVQNSGISDDLEAAHLAPIVAEGGTGQGIPHGHKDDQNEQSGDNSAGHDPKESPPDGGAK
eukprot:GHVS01088624.1.p1 GENE.GHVS01088624.1~~GHVS01088624.1.p1  ORF type:complete len:896 (+),score=106.44 GHVS01088624.1:63-2690(+)